MQLVEGWTALVERVGPMAVVPVVSALVVTVLWWLTGGWTWFDLGPWPWALGALPVVLLAAVRLASGVSRRHHARTAVTRLGAALTRLGHRVPDAQVGLVRAAIRLARARLGREGLQELSEVLEDAALDRVRSADDPLAAALQLLDEADGTDVSAELAAVELALAEVEADGFADRVGLPSQALTLLYLTTLPVGLVTTTGWWTFAAVAGIALSHLAIEVAADGLERPLGPAGGIPVDAILDVCERRLRRRT